MRILDDFIIDSFLFKYEGFEFTGECNPRRLLWNDNYDHFHSLDKILSKTVESQFGPLEVNYAVYKDGVEAHLKVMLTACCFSSIKVYGQIIATHSATSDSRPSMSVLGLVKRQFSRCVGLLLRFHTIQVSFLTLLSSLKIN